MAGLGSTAALSANSAALEQGKPKTLFTAQVCSRDAAARNHTIDDAWRKGWRTLLALEAAQCSAETVRGDFRPPSRGPLVRCPPQDGQPSATGIVFVATKPSGSPTANGRAAQDGDWIRVRKPRGWVKEFELRRPHGKRSVTAAAVRRADQHLPRGT